MSKDRIPQDLLEEEPMIPEMYYTLMAQKNRSYYFQIPGADGRPLKVLIRPRDRNFNSGKKVKENTISSENINPYAPMKRPGLLWIHGGAFYMGSAETIFTTLANQIGDRFITVAPEYSLEPYPKGLNDCFATLKWMVDNADSLGIDPERIIVGGDSAGGGMAIGLCLYCRDHQGPKIAMQIPLYPMLDYRMITPSSSAEDMVFWNASENQEAWNRYLSNIENIEKGKEVPAYASPSVAADYSNLPPCITLVGTEDIFHDEVKQYVEDLRKANVPVEFKEFEGGYHMFDVLAPGAKLSQEARKFFNKAFDTFTKKYLDQ